MLSLRFMDLYAGKSKLVMKKIEIADPTNIVFLSPILAITNTVVKLPNNYPTYIIEFEISPNCP